VSDRQLIVNVEAIAALRRLRGGPEPDPVAAAQLALLGGADGIGLTLREDRSHGQQRDARVLRHTVHRGFWLALGATPEMLKVALEIRPDVAVLMAAREPEGAASDGLEAAQEIGPLGEMLRTLEDGKVSSLLSIRPELDHVKAAHRMGAFGVELHAARFAEEGPDCEEEFGRLCDCASLAAKLGLFVCAGRGLGARSLRRLADVRQIHAFHVGFAPMARAVLIGVERAVRELRALV
jgi:pyridoxine 5-phosphate synthase